MTDLLPVAIARLLTSLKRGYKPTDEELGGWVGFEQEAWQRLIDIRDLYPVVDDAGWAPSWEQGDLVCGRYEVDRFLGQGGCGETWLVKDRDGREWVLKRTLNPPCGYSASSTLIRLSEDSHLADLTAGLRLPPHPYAVRYHGFEIDEDEDELYIVMDYARHGSLADQVSSRLELAGVDPSAKWSTALRWAAQSAWGIAWLHLNRMIHQDIKPANLLLCDEGEDIVIRVADYGLVRQPLPRRTPAWRTRRGGHTRVDPVGQTPLYGSPEQAAGLQLSPKSDVYSWGRTWAEAVGCDLRFGVDAASITRAQKEFVGKPPLAGLDNRFAGLIHECLAEHPLDRPAMAEVAYACRELAMIADPHRLLSLPRILVGRNWSDEAKQSLQQFCQKRAAFTCDLLGELSDRDVAGVRKFIESLNADKLGVIDAKAKIYLENDGLDELLQFLRPVIERVEDGDVQTELNGELGDLCIELGIEVGRRKLDGWERSLDLLEWGLSLWQSAVGGRLPGMMSRGLLSHVIEHLDRWKKRKPMPGEVRGRIHQAIRDFKAASRIE